MPRAVALPGGSGRLRECGVARIPFSPPSRLAPARWPKAANPAAKRRAAHAHPSPPCPQRPPHPPRATSHRLRARPAKVVPPPIPFAPASFRARANAGSTSGGSCISPRAHIVHRRTANRRAIAAAASFALPLPRAASRPHTGRAAESRRIPPNPPPRRLDQRRPQPGWAGFRQPLRLVRLPALPLARSRAGKPGGGAGAAEALGAEQFQREGRRRHLAHAGMRLEDRLGSRVAGAHDLPEPGAGLGKPCIGTREFGQRGIPGEARLAGAGNSFKAFDAFFAPFAGIAGSGEKELGLALLLGAAELVDEGVAAAKNHAVLFPLPGRDGGGLEEAGGGGLGKLGGVDLVGLRFAGGGAGGGEAGAQAMALKPRCWRMRAGGNPAGPASWAIAWVRGGKGGNRVARAL